jgi:non-specific serine/threonine protein kinase
MLVFTQYKSMVSPLESYLESLFGYKGLTIDGSVSSDQRTKRVNLFNSKEYYPFMVITIKAGGTG